MELGGAFPLSLLLRTKDQFALFVVSSFVAKLLHLYSHRESLPILLVALYTPTFLLPDVLLVLFGKLVVYRQHRGRTSAPRKAVGALLALINAGAAASTISFYIETGGEIQWLAGKSLAADPGAVRMMLAELPNFTIAMLALCFLAWLVSPRLYDLVEYILDKINLSFRQMYRFLRHEPQLSGIETPRDASETIGLMQKDGDEQEYEYIAAPPITRSAVVCVAVIATIVTASILQIVRPRRAPYAHMSGSIPFTIIGSFLFNPINSDFCLPRPIEPVQFPLEQFAKYSWATGEAPFPDWKPVSEACRRPSRHEFAGNGTFDETPRKIADPYDPSCDPLKVSNLEEDVIEPLTEAIKQQKPAIKNIVLLTLESTRKDMFPFKKDSAAYKAVLSTYDSPAAAPLLDEKLSALTETAALLSGEVTGFEETNSKPKHAGKTWRTMFEGGKGGINVNGAISASAFTLKSLLTSHCGVEALPVDFTEEVRGQIYQPCLPHIMDLFNNLSHPHGKKQKQKGQHGEDFLSWPWESVEAQSVTDQFDNQDVLTQQMGFRNVILESTLTNETSAHSPPQLPKNNYFGFPETELMPYLRDLFLEAKKSKKRLFLSHLTSTPHHPFSVPASWSEQDAYLAKRRWRPEDPFDKYLNTIKYQDEWIGQIFDMLEEVGALNETLVVLVGDHGLAFDLPDGSHSTFENGNVANFNIPLVFAHPQLPRVQLSTQTTPTSIIPTLLDLLLQTGSLGGTAADAARRLLPRYQGNSLIRGLDFALPTPRNTSAEDGYPRGPSVQPWHFGIINPGGSVVAVSSAGAPWRLVMPLCSTAALRFTDDAHDDGPLAHRRPPPIEAWDMRDLVERVHRVYGAEAAEWASLAQKLGRWWFWEQRERWGYHKAARSTDRSAEGEGGAGKIKKEHWWET